VQETATVREQNLGQEIRKGREEKEREVNFLRQETRNKEEELVLKLSKLSEEYEKLKSNMVSTILFYAIHLNMENITKQYYIFGRENCRLYTKYVKYRVK
jgi:uncharacterized protein YtpQ (UPF0354 family)